MSVTPARTSVLLETADLLLAARRTTIPMADLPAALAPASEEEAFAVQDIMAQAYGPIGGWKIGAKGTEGIPVLAPMPAAWMAPNGAEFRGKTHRLRGVECEIAFQIGADLPPRAIPYSRDEVIAAIASCNPAIEVLESGYTDPLIVSRANMLADLQMHGGFVAGPAIANWQSLDIDAEHITLLTDGVVRAEGTGTSFSGNDLVRLIVYLANDAAPRTGGLKKGDWVTTGSWTGANWVTPGTEVIAEFSTAGRAVMQFGPEIL
jgi:2-keto-4-pentenoate hydratase